MSVPVFVVVIVVVWLVGLPGWVHKPFQVQFSDGGGSHWKSPKPWAQSQPGLCSEFQVSMGY